MPFSLGCEFSTRIRLKSFQAFVRVSSVRGFSHYPPSAIYSAVVDLHTRLGAIFHRRFSCNVIVVRSLERKRRQGLPPVRSHHISAPLVRHSPAVHSSPFPFLAHAFPTVPTRLPTLTARPHTSVKPSRLGHIIDSLVLYTVEIGSVTW
jgi:hypothetical protein